MDDGATTIGRMRIRTSADDTLAVRMRSETALRTLDLQPPGMPSRAILCIRALSDPMPGGIDLRSSHAPRAIAWERAARNAIRDAFRRAVRPARGFVPAAADTVLFADRAELLACAARDAAGGLLDAWWWKNLLRGMSLDAVVREWLREPPYIAAALELLATRGEATAFVRILGATDSVLLLEAVLRAHRLEEVARAVVEAMTRELAPQPFRVAASLPPTLPPRAPWRELPIAIDEPEEASLTLEQRTFAGVTLALRHAPALVATAKFTAQVVRWIDQVREVRREGEATRFERQSRRTHAELFGKQVLETRQPSARERARVSEPTRGSDREPLREAPASIESTMEKPARSASSDGSFTTVPLLPTAQTSPVEPQERRPAAVEPERVRPNGSPDIRVQKGAAPSEEFALEPAPQDDEPDLPYAPLASLTEEAIDSAYAGVFFLLNVAMALDLYGRWRNEGIALDPWTFLAHVGRNIAPEIVDDPIWPLLQALAPSAREGAPHNLAPGSAGGTGGRARIRRPRRRPLHRFRDILCSGRLRGRQNLGNVPHPPAEPGASNVRRAFARRIRVRRSAWPNATRIPRMVVQIRALTLRIRHRLALAIDAPDPAALVVRRYGRIALSPTHLDVTFSLAAHPIEIRLAGLDRDPGWIPAAGRHVAFHFD
jgi:hypothetical protein